MKGRIVVQRGGYRAGTTEREIVLRFPARCRLCNQQMGPGGRALWAKNFGVRCPDNDSGEPTCISRFYTEDEAP